MAACVNVNSKEFKDTAKRLNLDEKYLEPIIHKYINIPGNEDSFPSDSYILEQLTPKPILNASKELSKLWKDFYSSPLTFTSFSEFQEAFKIASHMFGFDSVVPIERANGTYELKVGIPIESEYQKQPDKPIDIKSLKFYSGAAKGSDKFWAESIKEKGGTVKDYTIDNYETLPKEEKDKIEQQYIEVVNLLGRHVIPVWGKGGKFVRRDMMQANSADTIFAVGFLEFSFVSGKTLPSGGTAYAVARAIIDGKPVYFFDQTVNKWHFYNKESGSWEIVQTPVITDNSALIGTRELQYSGKRAIKDVINKTLGIKNEREFTFKDGITVDTPFKLNQQQEEALNAMNDFINSNETHMTLSGYAGTGKTSLMEILADKVRKDGKRIVFSATTNKAAAVLKSKVSKLGFSAFTLNKVFGISVEVDSTKEYDAKNLEKQIRESNILYGGEIVVIDEASMIDEGNYEILNSIARSMGLKIIYVGDKAQLAPVKETQVSKVFRDNNGKVAELTQVERTADNAILKEATNIRNGKPLSGESSFNSKGEGVAYVRQGDKSTVASIVRHFIQGLRSDPNHFRILAYTNAMVAKYNEAVRITLGYNDNTPRIGEPMVGYTNWGYINGGGYRFVNSESYKVTEVGQQEPRSIKISDKTYQFVVTPITLEDSLGTSDIFDYIDIKANAENRQNVIELAKLKSTLWEQYRRNFNREARSAIRAEINAIEKFLFVNDNVTEGKRTLQNKVIDFGYALTIHKSQGSTFTHVLMDDVDIQKAEAVQSTDLSNAISIDLDNEASPDYNNSEMVSEDAIDLGEDFSSPVTLQQQETRANIKQQLEYVGVSRATTTVTVISDDVKTEDSPLNHLNTNQKKDINNEEDQEKQDTSKIDDNIGIPERIDPQIATEEETKEVFNDGQSVREELQQFQDGNAHDTKQINNLFNDAKLSNTEVRYVAKQLIFGMSDFITDCLENPQKYLDAFPELFVSMTEEQKQEEKKKIGEMTRLEFFKYATHKNIVKYVANKMFSPKENRSLNTPKKAIRARTIMQNLDGLMRLANDYFVIAEDFSIVYTRDTNAITENINRISDDVNNEDDTNAELGKTLESWQFEFRTQSAISRMSQLVKKVLGRCFEYVIDKAGNYNKVTDEWGINKRVDMSVASSSIIAWTSGAESLSEMLEMLKAKEAQNLWLHDIVTYLEDTSGDFSDFQSQFYNVFAQSFQPYSIVKKEMNNDGEYEYKTLLLNEKPAKKKAYEDIKVAYQLNALPLFTNGNVNANVVSTLETIATQLVEFSNKGLEGSDWTKVIDLVYKAASAIGHNTTMEEVAATISSNAALIKVANAIQNIALNLKGAIGKAEYTPFKYGSQNNIGGYLENFLEVLTSKLEETAITSLYDNGKMYQSNVIPSYLTRLLNRFRTTDDAKLTEFIESEYGAYSWFKDENGWKNMVLRDFMRMSDKEARSKLFKHKVQLNFNKHNYMKDLTENELALSILTEYASGLVSAKGNVIPTWFKVPMLSNKPSSEFISLNAYVGDMVERKLLPGFAMIFMQELGRIQTVRIRDYDKSDPEFIKNFDKNGKKFMFLDFFNKYLKEGSKERNSELGKLINKALEEGTTYNINTNKGLTADENTRLNILVKEEIYNNMSKRAQDVVKSWKESGIFEAAKQIQGFSKDNAVLEKQLQDFVWNDAFAAMNILELTVTDIAFYKDAEDLQKRLAQIHAPGTKANVEARDYKGKKVSDGNFRTFLLKDFDDFISNVIDNLSIVFDKKIEEAKKDGTYTDAMRAFYDDILHQYREINVADAQGYSSPTSYRKKALLFGRWSKQAEEIYKKLSSDNYNYADLKVAFQPLKPFVYGQIGKSALPESGMTELLSPPMSKLKVPVQFKNSEYLLIMADAILKNENTGKPNLLRAIYNIMEDSAKEHPETCIDTVQFESTCKSGLMAPIDIKQFYNMENGEDAAYVYMRDRIYKNGSYNTDVYVYEMPFEYYSIQQEVPAHFKDHYQAHGSQIRYIIPSDLETVDSEGNEVTYNFFDNGVEKKLTAQEFRREYENNIALNIEESISKLQDELGLGDKFHSKKDRNIALSKILIKEVFDSPRYGVDLAVACSVNEETGEFNIPLGDPIQSKRIEQLINSVIKNRINKQEIAGGPVVQVSNFGTSKELHIRFKKKGGTKGDELLMTKEEFAKTAPEGKSYNIDAAYRKYVRDNQDGIAYYEVYAPIYVNDLFKQFADKNGNIDIKAIEEINPDLLNMIGYRIPTEDKYSMAPLKIVGFLPREAGDGIMLPNEITLITGSDFDVDKFYLMRKDIGINTRDKKDIRASLYESIGKEYKDSYTKKKKLSEAIEDFLANPIEMKNTDELNKKLWEIYKKVAFDIHVPTDGVAYRNNKVIDMSWAVLTHETTTDKVLNPGGFTPEKTMGYMVSAYQNPANKFTWEELNMLGNKQKGLLDKKLVDLDPENKDILVGVDALKDLCYTEKNLCYIDTHLQFYKQNSAAATALGMAAVQKVAHAVLESNGYFADIEKLTELEVAEEDTTGEEFLFEVAGFKIKPLMEIDAKKNADGALIGRTLGELVAMFADAVKDPVANLLNINNTMMPYLTTLIRLGMPFNKAALFIAQPIIRDALVLYNTKNLNGYTKFSDIISELQENLAKDLRAEEESNYNKINSLTEEQLVKNLKNFDRSKITDYVVLGFLQKVSNITDAIKPLTYATRFNSISNAVGPQIIDNLMMEFKMNKMIPSKSDMSNRETAIYNREGDVVGFDDVLAEHPILYQFARAVDIANEVFADMPTNHETFRKILIEADEDLRETLLHDRKLLGELSDFFQSYLLVSSGVVKEDGSQKHQGLKYYIEQFPKDFMAGKAKSIFAGNALIDAIRFDIQKGKLVLKIDTTGMQTQDKERLSDAWVDLYNSGERGEKLALHLFYYNFFRTGIGFSPKSFMGLFPSRLKSKIPGYMEAFNIMSDNFAKNLDKSIVRDQFIRNNVDNNKLVPRITLGKDGYSYDIVEETKDIIVKNAKDLEKKMFVKTKKNGIFTLYKQKSADTINHTVTYKVVEILGNNGEYFEVSTNKNYKAVTITTDVIEQSKDNGIVDLQNQIEDTPSEPSQAEIEKMKAERARKIRDKIIEWYRSVGKTANDVEAYKDKPEETKRALAPQMKQFFREKLSEEGIKYDSKAEKLVDEMYDSIC